MTKEKLHIFNDAWKEGYVPQAKETEVKVDFNKLTAMGSCFARNVNRYLLHQNISDRQMPWDILYNPFSIEKEIERLYKPVSAEENFLHEVTAEGQKRVRDPWRTWHTAGSAEELSSVNAAFDQKAIQFTSESNSVLITLGLTEVWSPKGKPEIVLNQVPLGSLRAGNTDWESRFASVGETIQSLSKTVDLIRQNITADGAVIFTLSPVPLKFTASGLSIREANNISKSTLRVAIADVVRERGDVEYFPSYEMVQAMAEQPGRQVWQDDFRHVTAKVVEEVSQRFLATYGGQQSPPATEAFWVPKVNAEGKIEGKLYVDGTVELNA